MLVKLNYAATQDEVDDTRTTLAYAVKELQADLEAQVSSKSCRRSNSLKGNVQIAQLPEDKRSSIPKTEFAIFVGGYLAIHESEFLLNGLILCSAQQAEAKDRYHSRFRQVLLWRRPRRRLG